MRCRQKLYDALSVRGYADRSEFLRRNNPGPAPDRGNAAAVPEGFSCLLLRRIIGQQPDRLARQGLEPDGWRGAGLGYLEAGTAAAEAGQHHVDLDLVDEGGVVAASGVEPHEGQSVVAGRHREG